MSQGCLPDGKGVWVVETRRIQGTNGTAGSLSALVGCAGIFDTLKKIRVCPIWDANGEPHLSQKVKGARMESLNLANIMEAPTTFPLVDLRCKFAHHAFTFERPKAVPRFSLARLDARFASLQHGAFRGEL